MADMTSVMNAILTAGSAEYAARVPVATRDNITSVAAPIIKYQSTQNEFLSALVNRIGMTIIRNNILKNPLAPLKKGSMPLGKDIEEIFTNPARAQKFGNSTTSLLTQTASDTYAIFHRLNREDQYPVTITKPQLQQAFTSWGELENLLNSITNSMYAGNEYDEFILMKNMFADAITGGKVLWLETADITSAGGALQFAKDLKKAHKAMAFPGSAFNMFKPYNAAQTPAIVVNPIITWTPKEKQVLIMRADVDAEMAIDVLAYAFHDDKIDIETRKVEVDDFGTATNAYAILADEAWVQAYDNVFETSEFYNAKELSWNYYLNVFQTLSVSLFANAVAFGHTPTEG